MRERLFEVGPPLQYRASVFTGCSSSRVFSAANLLSVNARNAASSLGTDVHESTIEARPGAPSAGTGARRSRHTRSREQPCDAMQRFAPAAGSFRGSPRQRRRLRASAGRSGRCQTRTADRTRTRDCDWPRPPRGAADHLPETLDTLRHQALVPGCARDLLTIGVDPRSIRTVAGSEVRRGSRGDR